MPKCSYCGKMYDVPRGLTYVLKDGKVKSLCSSKCRKNMLMKRRKVRWVSKAKQTRKELLAEIKGEAAEAEAAAEDKKEAEKEASKVGKKEEAKTEDKKE